MKDALFTSLQYLHAIAPTLEPLICLSTILLCIFANIWGVITALSSPTVREIEVPVVNFRIAQISDLHVGPIIKREFVEKVVEKVLQLKPNVIAITGDLGDGDVDELGNDLEPLRQLPNAYYVTGNHEYYWNVEKWIAKVKELGITPLQNEGQWLNEKIWIGGVRDISCKRIRPDHESNPNLAIHKAAAYKILLAHQPKSCYAAAEAGFDLMLAGHTHRGQFFPISLIVGFFHPFHKGLHQYRSMKVYVNAGTGFWGPPLRLWVPSEITLLRLVNKLL